MQIDLATASIQLTTTFNLIVRIVVKFKLGDNSVVLPELLGNQYCRSMLLQIKVNIWDIANLYTLYIDIYTLTCGE